MRILVTGGTGFVGPKIVHALRARNLDVRALARRPESQGRLIATISRVTAVVLTILAPLVYLRNL